MTFDLGDIDNITQFKVNANITNDITSGKIQSAQHNNMQIKVCTVKFTNSFHTDSANPDLIRIPFTRPFHCSKNTLPYA